MTSQSNDAGTGHLSCHRHMQNSSFWRGAAVLGSKAERVSGFVNANYSTATTSFTLPRPIIGMPRSPSKPCCWGRMSTVTHQ